MSKNKSYMPNGGYTLTQGSNYMMDGFHFDTEYGGGPQEKARLPEARGLADLPSGMVPLDSSGVSTLPSGVETEVDLNMEELTREASQEIQLVDHSWLATEPEPDLSGQIEMEEVYKGLEEGHMNNDTHNKLKELQNSWGQTSTTGLDIIPNENRTHDKYHNSYREDQSRLPGDAYRQMMEKGVRKLAYGNPMNVVLSEMDSENILDVKTKLSSEYGLHGRVYIKEEHFPGLFNGRWNEVINKRCATAMYIVPKNEDCSFERFLGMEVVNKVPYSKAAKSLLPKLESYGVRIASGTPKERLKSAFIDLIEGRVNNQEKSATWFPTQLDQSSLISLDQAHRELESAREENIFVASMEEVEQSKAEIKLAKIAQQLVSQNFLDSEQVSAIVELDNKTASQKIKRLYELASTPMESGSYGGQGMGVKAHTPHKSKIEENFKTRSEKTFEQRLVQAKTKVAKLVKAGLISDQEVKAIFSKYKDPEDKIKAVFKRVSSLMEKEEIYEGQGKESSYHNMKRHFADASEIIDTRESRNLTSRNNSAKDKVARLIQSGLISISEVEEVVQGHSTAEDKLAAIYGFLARPDQVGNYEGAVEAHYMTKKSKLDPKAKYLTQDQIDLTKRTKLAMEKISRIIKAGLISYEEVERATKNKRTPEDRVASVFEYLASPKEVKDYDGVVSTAHIITAKNKLPKGKVKTTEVSEGRKIASKVDHYISNGILSEEDVNHAFSLKGEAKFRALYKLAVSGASAKKTEFKGQRYKAHMAKKASAPTKTAHEVQSDKIATWLRQKMSEGSAGEELDVLIATRFNQNTISAHDSRITSVRSEHEGLSGHVYVDASSYMTKGIEGCDKGALVHRANQIPTLLKTSKCGSCVFNSGGVCQKYNKPIVASVNEVVENPSSYKEEMIRLANASDSEQTASLFVNNYDANEFNLTANQDVSVDDSPDSEQLGDVLFGGFEV